MPRVKKAVNRIVEDEVANLLLQNPDFTGFELKRRVEKSLEEKYPDYKFTERTYLNIKNRLSLHLNKDNPLDQPWSAGACMKYDIPPQYIPLLIEIKTGKKGLFTIREAKWLTLILMAKNIRGDKTNLTIGLESLIKMAEDYARVERISEMGGRLVVDTTELDRQYFGEEDHPIKGPVENVCRSQTLTEEQKMERDEIIGKTVRRNNWQNFKMGG